MSANEWMRQDPKTNNVEIIETEQFNTVCINEKDSVNIVTIVGEARAGKSTLGNCLVGDNVFNISHSNRPCTHGVWLSKSKKLSGNGVVVYADTEGEGNDGTDNDVKLLTPVLMLSKVIILNVPGRILVAKLLEKLALLVHIAKRKDHKNDQFKFGHLIIAVRDYDFEDGTEEELRDRYFARENTNNEAAVKRNATRDIILPMFESVQVNIFRHSLKIEQNNPETNKLKGEINEMIRTPRIIAEGTCLTLGNVGTLTKEFVDHLNNNKDFDVLTIVGMIQRKEIDEEHKRCKELMLKKFDEQVYRERGIVDILTNHKNKLIQQFTKNTEKASSESQYRDDLKKDLEEFFSQRLAAIKEMIKREQYRLVDDEKAKFEIELRNSFENFVLPVIQEDCLKKGLIEKRNSYLARFDRATGEVDLGSAYKTSVRENLQSFASEEMNKILEKNRDKKAIKCGKIGGVVTALSAAVAGTSSVLVVAEVTAVVVVAAVGGIVVGGVILGVSVGFGIYKFSKYFFSSKKEKIA